MTLLVGIDVQPIDEVATSIRRYGTRYTQRLFTEHELDNCGENPNAAASGLAARLAAKEAMLKALDLNETALSWRAIEVKRTGSGRPEIVLHDEAAEVAQRQGIQQIFLTISHGGGIAAAAVVAQVSKRDVRTSR